MRSRGRAERRSGGEKERSRRREEDSLGATGLDPARELRCHGNGLGKPLTSKFC